jgi:NADPH:quinone reductase-like Zn-dependent oxidoreductase
VRIELSKRRILGTEFAGVVAAVGTAISGFKVGDRVFGVNHGNFGAHRGLSMRRISQA